MTRWRFISQKRGQTWRPSVFIGGVICSILAAGTAITVFVAWDRIQRFCDRAEEEANPSDMVQGFDNIVSPGAPAWSV